jgi:hypothetical protein
VKIKIIILNQRKKLEEEISLLKEITSLLKDYSILEL